jgi:hypothetical protein
MVKLTSVGRFGKVTEIGAAVAYQRRRDRFRVNLTKAAGL